MRTHLPLAFAALVLLTAACGGGSDEVATPVSTVTAGASATTAPASTTVAPTTATPTVAPSEPPASTAAPVAASVVPLALTSTAFTEGEAIPVRFSCDGDDVSPPLAISGIPDGTVALALVVDDPDAPGGTWDHWVVYDIAPTTTIGEGATGLGTDGKNSWGDTGYGGPCPPGGTHHYGFHLWALDARTGLAAGAKKSALLAAIEGHVLASTTLTGTYSR